MSDEEFYEPQKRMLSAKEMTESRIPGMGSKVKGYAAREKLGIGNDSLFGKVMQNGFHPIS